MLHRFQNATTCPIFANSDVDGGWSPFSMWHKCAKSEQLNDYDYEPTAANADTCLCKTRTCNNPGKYQSIFLRKKKFDNIFFSNKRRRKKMRRTLNYGHQLHSIKS